MVGDLLPGTWEVGHVIGDIAKARTGDIQLPCRMCR